MEVIIVPLIFLVLSVSLTVGYPHLLTDDLLPVAQFMLLMLIPGALLIIFFCIYSYFSFFMACASLPAFLLTIWYFLTHRKPGFTKNASQTKRRLYIIGFVAIVLFQFAPWWGVGIVASVCNQLNQNTAMQIVPALESYRQQNGEYPSKLDMLVPDYIPALPEPQCFEPYYQLGTRDTPVTYSFETCQQGENILVTQTLTLGGILRYNLATQNWSDIGVFDGPCGAQPIR